MLASLSLPFYLFLFPTLGNPVSMVLIMSVDEGFLLLLAPGSGLKNACMDSCGLL
jgi:hypothetical protein